MIRSQRPADGGSIRSARHRASSSPADPVSAALGLADAGGQPFGELAAVLGAALPEPEVAAALRPVVLERVPAPLIETKVGGGDADLPGDELHRVVGQLRPPAREPAVPGAVPDAAQGPAQVEAGGHPQGCFHLGDSRIRLLFWVVKGR
jgi:hypothetical protein